VPHKKKPKERHCADYLVVAQAQCGQKITPDLRLGFRARSLKFYWQRARVRTRVDDAMKLT